MANILIAEDDLNSNKFLCAIVRRMGHTPIAAKDGVDALDLLETNHVDLFVLDIMMPRMNGMELLEALREAGMEQPVLMLTARSAQEDKNAGLAYGADDYMTKPCDIKELSLRIDNLLRRSGVSDKGRLVVGNTVLDRQTLSVSRLGEEQVLPLKEFELLAKLIAHPERTFTRMQLLDEIWGFDSESSEATVNVHVNRLRKRFEGWNAFEIVTVRGVGYKAEIKE